MEAKDSGVGIQTIPEIADVVPRRSSQLPFTTGAVALESVMQESDIETIIRRDTKESLTEQLPTAHTGYQAVVSSLRRIRRQHEQIPITEPENLKQGLAAWLTDEKVAYVAAAQEADPEVRFTLVATPNVLVSDIELARAAKDFGKSQPYETYVWSLLHSKYSLEQLSGTNPNNGNSVVFSLIPSKYTSDMEGAVAIQRMMLTELQKDNPDLKVPSLLEAVTYWQTLRAQGYELRGDIAHELTYIRHFDLPIKPVDDDLYVPKSSIEADGEPLMYRSEAQNYGHARIALG